MEQPAVLILLGSAPTADGEFARAARLCDIGRLVEIMHGRGLHVAIATRNGATIVCAGTPPLATSLLRALDESAYDALLVLDGDGTCLDLRDDLAFARIIRRFDVTPRPLALAGSAIEAVASIRRSAGPPMLRNRRIAASAETADRLRAVGAEPLVEPDDAEHVSVDAYLVTAQNARSLLCAGQIVIAYLTSPIRRRSMRAS